MTLNTHSTVFGDLANELTEPLTIVLAIENWKVHKKSKLTSDHKKEEQED